MDIQRIDNQVVLRQLWPELSEQLHTMKRRCAEPWFVEDVWVALINQQATLYIGKKDGETVGFLVSEIVWDAFAVAPVLNIWIAVGYDLLATHGEQVINAMRKVATDAGASCVRMMSPRRGWERSGLDKLMSPVRTVWECEV